MQKIRLKKQKKSIDRRLLIFVLILSGLGLLFIADASAPQALNNFSDQFYFVKQQAVWGFLGIILLFVASRIHYSFWEKMAVPIFAVGVVILALVLLPSVGVKTLGARRWLFIGSISLQPSEFIKLALAMYLAKAIAKKKSTLAYFLPLLLVAGLIIAQPDFGTMIVVSGIGLAQIFISGIKLIPLVGTLLVGGALSLLAILTSDYRKQRVLTYFELTKDPLGSAYHIRQILLALGSGGLLGVGLGQSRQKYLFLPEAATDSIFAVIAEEVGFIGASVIIIIFAMLIYRGFKIAKGAPDTFSQVLAVGITTWIGGQAFLNIAAMTAILPLTGIPFPFFSYGGSALTMVLFATGILLNISKYETKDKTRR